MVCRPDGLGASMTLEPSVAVPRTLVPQPGVSGIADTLMQRMRAGSNVAGPGVRFTETFARNAVGLFVDVHGTLQPARAFERLRHGVQKDGAVGMALTERGNRVAARTLVRLQGFFQASSVTQEISEIAACDDDHRMRLAVKADRARQCALVKRSRFLNPSLLAQRPRQIADHPKRGRMVLAIDAFMPRQRRSQHRFGFRKALAVQV